MKRFKKILVYLPELSSSDPALKRAAELAKANAAALKIVYVATEIPRYVTGLMPDDWDVQALIKQEARTKLGELAAPLRDDGIEVDTEVFVGPPALEVTREVLRNGHDLVMKTAEGEDALLGTTGTRLMRMCPCPVWVIHAEQKERFRKILAAVDPVPEEPKRDALNIKILELASSLAEIDGAEFHVFHAWTAYGEALLSGRFPEEEFRQYVEKERAEATKRVRELLSRAGVTVPGERLQLVKGLPGLELPRFARRGKFDLAVMGTVARTGIKGFFIGNTAEKVLRKIECSLLTVKPDSFVSPVTLES